MIRAGRSEVRGERWSRRRLQEVDLLDEITILQERGRIDSLGVSYGTKLYW